MPLETLFRGAGAEASLVFGLSGWRCCLSVVLVCLLLFCACVVWRCVLFVCLLLFVVLCLSVLFVFPPREAGYPDKEIAGVEVFAPRSRGTLTETFQGRIKSL